MFGDRLMAGHQVLILRIGVRIPIPEPYCIYMRIQYKIQKHLLERCFYKKCIVLK